MLKHKFFSFWSFNYFLLLVIAIAVLLRVIQLGSRELWYDEVLSLLLATGNKIFYRSPENTAFALSAYHSLLTLPNENNFADTLVTISHVLKGILAEPHPPLFFLEQHLWLRLWGNSEAAMRSLVMLFSLGAIGCAYGLGRRLLGHRGGLFLAALLGLNPFYLFHSLNLRMYGSLVFWAILTAWALTELIPIPHGNPSQNFKQNNWSWWFLLILGTASGLLTFYYFAVWVLTLSIGVLIWDRRQWWRYAIAFLIASGFNLPWWLWGTRQQLNNADLERFTDSNNFIVAIAKHLQELTQTLGTQLVLGDWASISPSWLISLTGLGAIAGLGLAIWMLKRQKQGFILGIGLLMGVFSLTLMFLVDVLKGQYTLGFGFGRSVIFILPGCLLLIAAAIVRANPLAQRAIATSLLVLYLGLNLADMGLRSREMFAQVANAIPPYLGHSTLIAINSRAWGHTFRLAYYLSPSADIQLLAQQSPQLPKALNQALFSNTYDRILWLDFMRPLWGEKSTEEERQKIQQILTEEYTLDRRQVLRGTWDLDNFVMNSYQKSPQSP
jgi:uncharacterized membrane protein